MVFSKYIATQRELIQLTFSAAAVHLENDFGLDK